MKNAFNTANWLNIVNALKALKTPQYLVTIIQDYLSNRVLIYDTDLGPMQYNVTAGVPHVSVLGPLLWNVIYDGVLRIVLAGSSKMFGFADDIALQSCHCLPDRRNTKSSKRGNRLG